MEKSELRGAAEDRRRTGVLPDGNLFAAQITGLIRRLGARSVAAYYPFGTEPDLRDFLDSIPQVAVPRLFTSAGESLQVGHWGLHRRDEAWEQPRPRAPLQPRTAIDTSAIRDTDLFLVPALAVSESGDRLGRGGGWYDRVLEQVGARATIYAVVYSWEVLPVGTIPIEPHDRPVHGVVTELTARELRGRDR